jgi:CheY-like chemotaxis protein
MAPQTDGGAADPAACLLNEFPGQKVLIVDDDVFVRCMLTDMLSDTGLSLDEAHNGSEAVALCRQTPYAMVLMDLLMPGLSGVETTLQIRQLPGMECTPILALTGSVSVADRIHCQKAGMSDFITKPISSRALAAIILHWLRSSQP